MALSPELIRVYASGGVDDIIHETIALSHPNFSATWYIVNSPYAITAKLEDGTTIVTFQPYPFQMAMAGTGEDGNQDVQVAISNVSRTPIDEIESAAENPTQQIQMVYRSYIDGSFNTPAQVINGLSLASINVTENQITGTASPSDLLNRVFPSRLYTINSFPGLSHV